MSNRYVNCKELPFFLLNLSLYYFNVTHYHVTTGVSFIFKRHLTSDVASDAAEAQ